MGSRLQEVGGWLQEVNVDDRKWAAVKTVAPESWLKGWVRPGLSHRLSSGVSWLSAPPPP